MLAVLGGAFLVAAGTKGWDPESIVPTHRYLVPAWLLTKHTAIAVVTVLVAYEAALGRGCCSRVDLSGVFGLPWWHYLP